MKDADYATTFPIIIIIIKNKPPSGLNFKTMIPPRRV